MAVHNKLLIYNQIPKPTWTYSIQIWRCTSKSITQTWQNKILCVIVDAQYYVRNSDLHRNMKIIYNTPSSKENQTLQVDAVNDPKYNKNRVQ